MNVLNKFFDLFAVLISIMILVGFSFIILLNLFINL